MVRSKRIVLIVHNLRSAHNVGSILRSADGFGAEKVYLTGYSPYPESANDQRLPHISQKISQAVHKTALGAERSVPWEHRPDINRLLRQLAADGYSLAALEQTPQAINLDQFDSADDIALVLGNEITGVEPKILGETGLHLQIPMLGAKESLNVAAAAAIALYHLRLG